jgi:hypothetical protein
MNVLDLKALDPLNSTPLPLNSDTGVPRSLSFLPPARDIQAMEKFERLGDVQNPKLKVWYEPGIDAW